MGLTETEVEAQTEEEFAEEISFVVVVPAFILSSWEPAEAEALRS